MSMFRTIDDLIEEYKKKASLAVSNPAAYAKAKLVEGNLSRLEKQKGKLKAELQQLCDQLEAEGAAIDPVNKSHVFTNPEGLARRIAEPLVGVKNWPEDVDTKAAIAALLRLSFADQRAKYLKELIRAKSAEIGEVDKRIADLGKELNAAHSALLSS